MPPLGSSTAKAIICSAEVGSSALRSLQGVCLSRIDTVEDASVAFALFVRRAFLGKILRQTHQTLPTRFNWFGRKIRTNK